MNQVAIKDLNLPAHYAKYYNTGDQYDNNAWVTAQCAEITFVNYGNGVFPLPTGANVMLLGFVLLPGFGVAFDGNDGEMDVTKYYLTFVGAGARNCIVLRKNYA